MRVAASRPLRAATLSRCRRSSGRRTGCRTLSRPVPVRRAIVVGWRAGGELTPCDVSTALFVAAPLLLLLNAMVLPQGEYDGCGKEARRGREERKEGRLGRQGSGRGGRGEGPVYIRSPLCALFGLSPTIQSHASPHGTQWCVEPLLPLF